MAKMTIEEWKLLAEQERKQEKDELVEYLETIKNNEDKLKEITDIQIECYEDGDLDSLSDKPLLLQAILSELLKIVLRGDINDWEMDTEFRTIIINPAPWEGVDRVDLTFWSEKLDKTPCNGKPYGIYLQATRLWEVGDGGWTDEDLQAESQCEKESRAAPRFKLPVITDLLLPHRYPFVCPESGVIR